jgi:prepilin-type N-terminal cleavage/methylation domain-containing protein
MKTIRRKFGFTLAEILVALALIALLAAVLLPTVAGQILKGDAGRVMQDVDAVRSGIDQFLADIHRYPLKYTNLSRAIAVSDSDITPNPYTSGLVSKWAGPYITKDTVGYAVTQGVATGFGGTIANRFIKVTHTNGVQYVTVVITGIAGPDFDKIDLQVDGAVNRTGGLLRWVTGGASLDTTKYLATPIQ